MVGLLPCGGWYESMDIDSSIQEFPLNRAVLVTTETEQGSLRRTFLHESRLKQHISDSAIQRRESGINDTPRSYAITNSLSDDEVVDQQNLYALRHGREFERALLRERNPVYDRVFRGTPVEDTRMSIRRQCQFATYGCQILVVQASTMLGTYLCACLLDIQSVGPGDPVSMPWRFCSLPSLKKPGAVNRLISKWLIDGARLTCNLHLSTFTPRFSG